MHVHLVADYVRWHREGVVIDYAHAERAVDYSRWLCRHNNDYANTFGILRMLFTDFKGTIRWKKVLGCVHTANSNNLKIWKPSYLKKTDKVCETVFACSYGTQVESFKQKNNNSLKSCDTVPLRQRR